MPLNSSKERERNFQTNQTELTVLSAVCVLPMTLDSLQCQWLNWQTSCLLVAG